MRLLELFAGGALVAALAVAATDVVHPMFNDLPWVGAGLGVAAGVGALLARRHRTGRAAAATAVASVLWLATTGDHLGPVPARMVVFGVDGALWSLIDAEPLPAFHRASREGTRADLISMEPMFSPLLWTTIASGRTVNEHGVRGFRVQTHDCKVARWWDVAEARGDAVGLYKWLVDYPPRQFAHGGFWVPSWLAPAPDAWPESLAVVKEVELGNRLRRQAVGERGASLRRVAGLVGVGVRLGTLVRGAAWLVREQLGADDTARNVSMQLIRGEIDRDVFVAQLYARAPGVASLNYYATDGLAHLYWDRHEAGGPEVRAAYRQADEILGELMARLGPEARLLVVSDHGFQAMDAKGVAGQFLPLTERLRARLGAEVPDVDVTRIGHKLVVGTRSKADVERARAWLATLTDAEGEPFYVVADFPDDEASLALTLADEQITQARLGTDRVGGEPLSDYVTLTAAYTGMHEESGIFLAWGRGAPAGADLGEVPLLDAAPTLLAGAGLPAARDMPGVARVWPEIPRVESWDGLLRGRTAVPDGGVNEDMLKALGYVDDGKPTP